jgi:hypothetical protein
LTATDAALRSTSCYYSRARPSMQVGDTRMTLSNNTELHRGTCSVKLWNGAGVGRRLGQAGTDGI